MGQVPRRDLAGRGWWFWLRLSHEVAVRLLSETSHCSAGAKNTPHAHSPVGRPHSVPHWWETSVLTLQAFPWGCSQHGNLLSTPATNQREIKNRMLKMETTVFYNLIWRRLTITSATYYWWQRPTLIQRGTGLHNAMNTGRGNHWGPSWRLVIQLQKVFMFLPHKYL